MDAAIPSELAGDRDRLLLRSSKRKAIVLLFASLVLAATAFAMAISGDGVDRIVGLVGVIFFGLGAAVSLINAATNQSYLLLTRDGFQMHGIRKTKMIPWSDLAAIGVTTFGSPMRAKMVMFSFRPGAKSLDSYPQWARGLRSLNRSLTGLDGALPDTYGLKAEKLADLMGQWWSRFDTSRANHDEPAKLG